MRDEDAFRRNAEVTRHGANGLATVIHEGRRLEQPEIAAIDRQSAGQAVQTAFGAEGRSMTCRDAVNEPEADVVSGRLIARAWISQAHDQANAVPDRYSVHYHMDPGGAVAEMGSSRLALFFRRVIPYAPAVNDHDRLVLIRSRRQRDAIRQRQRGQHQRIADVHL